MTALTVSDALAAAKKALDGGNPEEAEKLARAVLAGGRGPLQAWMMLVTALRREGRHAEALPILVRLSEMVPQNYELHFDLAEIYLLLGDFERGWRQYRFRYGMEHTKALNRKVQAPRWEGQPFKGTLLIYDEQGYGDTFQFLRMVPWAKARSGAKVVLQISRELLPFAKRMPGIDEVIERGALPPPFDCHCQLMDLPMVTGLKLSDLPGKPMPYLAAEPKRLEKWRTRLSDLVRPLVALDWAGRPTHFNDANRSTKLETFAPLAEMGATFLSIQKGPKAAEAKTPPAGMKLVDLSSEIADFDDTAAVLSLADLLISIDSSPVHLAGALGCPAWVMLPFFPDWRWLLNRTDTPWYPSVRLFRQEMRGDWAGVVRRMADALRARTAPGA